MYDDESATSVAVLFNRPSAGTFNRRLQVHSRSRSTSTWKTNSRTSRRAIYLALIIATFSGQAWGAEISINEPLGSIASAYVASSTVIPDISIIGVYRTNGGRNHGPGTANVHVQYDDTRPMIPLVLVLSSYEPNQWTLDLEPDTVVSQIILNGYYPQEITNAGSIPVLRFVGPGNYFAACAYRWPDDDQGCDTPALVSGVESLVGQPITAFSGVYGATDFTVVGSPVPEPSSLTITLLGALGVLGRWRRRRGRQEAPARIAEMRDSRLTAAVDLLA